MAKFLLTAWPLSGHLNPAIAIADALRARGHQVAFYTGNTARSAVESENFNCFPFKEIDEDKIHALARVESFYLTSLYQVLTQAKRFKEMFRQWFLDTIPQQVKDLEGILEEWRPDVLVCDQMLWGPMLVLHETHRLPVAVFGITAACPLTGPDAPAWGRGLPRPRNWLMRQRSMLERRLVRWFSTDIRATVNALRRRYGLPELEMPAAEFIGRQTPLFMVPSTPEFDYERQDLPPSVHYVGPCLWDKAGSETGSDWLARLPGDRPLIYVTESTFHVPEPFLLRTVFRALSHKPVQVVMTTGKQRDPATLDLGPPAPNIQVERYIPQSDLMPRTSLVITLGGSGCVLTALKAGVPLVIVPTEWDRPENAQRVVEAGAGLRIAPNRCTPERMRTTVERILTDPPFRQNARRLAKSMARYEGPVRAAELLERLSPPAINEKRN